MNLVRLHSRSRLALLVAFVVGCAALFCGCNATGGSQGGLPVVGSLNVLDPGGLQLQGTVRYDGNKFIAWGMTHAEAELWMKGNGFPILGPKTWDPRRVIFHQDKPVRMDFEGDLAAPLPPEARELFRDIEVARYGLMFVKIPGAPGDTVPGS